MGRIKKGSAMIHYSTPDEAAEAASTLNGTTIEGNNRFIDVIQKGEADEQDAGNGKTNKKAKVTPATAKKAANGGAKKKSNKPCKWCEMGECWSHGQIEKPSNA